MKESIRLQASRSCTSWGDLDRTPSLVVQSKSLADILFIRWQLSWLNLCLWDVSCFARASAGRFNDIFVRDYSVFAESPVKILVLSRFDIFHLMSPEARESLQRSAAGFVRESIESRALKTIAWERYRKKFLEDFIASKRKSGIGSERGPSRLSKSTSTPALPTEKAVKQLVEPGCLMMERHHATFGFGNRPDTKLDFLFQANNDLKPARKLSRSDESKKAAVPEAAEDELQRRQFDSLLSSSSEEEDDFSPLPSCSPAKSKVKKPRRYSLNASGPEMSDALFVMEDLKKKLINIADDTEPSESLRRETSVDSRNQEAEAPDSSDGHDHIPIRRKTTISMQAGLSRSRTLATLNPLEGGLPPLHYDNPLHDPSITSGHHDRYRSTKSLKPDRLSEISSPALKVPTTTVVPAIWNPVHGVCQPFCLLGFMKEKVDLKANSSSSKPRIKHSAESRKVTTSSAMNGSSSLDVHHPAKARDFVIAFRVFGKFRDLNETLHIFRLVCGLERVPPPEKDTGRFAVYKEDEITMVLENFFSTDFVPETPQSESPGVLPSSGPYQFRAADLLHGNGQRFACVSVILEVPATVIENVTVHVYQCFPTLQSAVRFAKQMIASTLTAASLYIVPLFDWIPVSEIDRFDAKNSDLEQALEMVMDNGPSSYRSTWKARKDAIKKARALQPRSKPKSS